MVIDDMTNLDRAVGIIGVGECGTRIALELAGELQLGSLGDAIENMGFKSPSAKFRLLFRAERRASTLPVDARPFIFLGDFNRSNKIYVDAKKTSIIQELISSEPGLSDQDLLKKLKQNTELSRLGFQESDSVRISEIRNKKYRIPQFEMLDFYSQNQILLAPDGAGGLQYLSEAITRENDDLVQKISNQPSRIIFGIFGIGGGAGAGSIFSLLSRDALRKTRLSVGVGVLPGSGEQTMLRNAGRFLVRFLSRSLDERFDKLLLCSNRAAQFALDSLQENTAQQNEGERVLLNRYIAKTVFILSCINSKNVVVKTGKAIDTLDCKREWPSVITVGLAAKADGPIDFKDLFVRALSPMEYSGDDGLSGLSIASAKNKADAKAIASAVRKVFYGISEGGFSEKDVHEVSSKSGFYRLIRSVHLFLVSKESKDPKDIKDARVSLQGERLRDNVLRFFRELAGVDVNCVYCAYQFEGLSETILLALIDSGPSGDMVESLVRYVNPAFLGGDEARSREVHAKFGEAIRKIRGAASGIESSKLVETMSDELISIVSGGDWGESSRGGQSDVEYRSDNELAILKDASWVPMSLNNIGSQEYLIRLPDVRACICEILKMAIPPRKMIVEDDGDEPVY